MALGPFLFALVALALVVLGFYLFYGSVNRAFRAVGFTPAEASVILLATIIGSGLDIPIWPGPVGGGWYLAINVGGAVIPVIVSAWLLRRVPSMAMGALVGIVVVSMATYLVTSVHPDGIGVPLALALVPPVVAAAMSLTAYWREEDHAAPLAYVCGTFGALIGADVLRFWEFVQQAPPEPGAVASIGGAAVFDMVFLTGIIAVGLDALVFRRRQKERSGANLPYIEPEVFTVSTSPERLADWKVPSTSKAVTVRAAVVRERPQTVRTIVQEPSSSVQRPRPQPPRPEPPRPQPPQPVSATSDDRLARHRAWEEQMRRQRGG